MTLGARAVVSCYSRRVRSADAIVDDCLDQSERALVSDALAVVSSVDPDLAGSLREGLERLERAADLVRSSPSILRSMETPRSSATYQTLLELMCSVPEWDFDLHVPVRVIFGQAYLVAKINFLKSVGYTLEETRAPEPLRDLLEARRRAVHLDHDRHHLPPAGAGGGSACVVRDLGTAIGRGNRRFLARARIRVARAQQSAPGDRDHAGDQ